MGTMSFFLIWLLIGTNQCLAQGDSHEEDMDYFEGTDDYTNIDDYTDNTTTTITPKDDAKIDVGVNLKVPNAGPKTKFDLNLEMAEGGQPTLPPGISVPQYCPSNSKHCGNICKKLYGGHCVMINPWNPESYFRFCDDFKTSLCSHCPHSHYKCGCCIKCDEVIKSPNCQASFGECRKTCKDNDEVIPNGCHGTNRCQCCAPKCEMDKTCCEKGGRCVKIKEECKGRVLDKGCKSGKPDERCFCFCCVDETPCIQTGMCADERHGECRKDCNNLHDHFPVPNVCKDNCTCCVKKCTQSSNCTVEGGRCIKEWEKCDGEVTTRCKCADTDCVCCRPSIECTQTTHACKEEGGSFCSDKCPSRYYERYGLCSGKCPCCIKPCQSRTCVSEGGICRTLTRRCKQIPGIDCNSDTCRCCRNMSNVCNQLTHACKQEGGFCRDKCPSQYYEKYGLCKGSGKCPCCFRPCQSRTCVSFGGTCKPLTTPCKEVLKINCNSDTCRCCRNPRPETSTYYAK